MLSGWVGGGAARRLNLKKALIVVAAKRMGLDRPDSYAPDLDASAKSLVPLCGTPSYRVASSTPMGGWDTYLWRAKAIGTMSLLARQKENSSELMPRVHRVISLLKRWLMGTHQGAVSHKHLDYYLDEFTFDSIGGDQKAAASSSSASCSSVGSRACSPGSDPSPRS